MMDTQSHTPERTRRKRKRGQKHTLSVREGLRKRQEERNKEKKDPRIKLTGFRPLTKGTFQWAGADRQGVIQTKERRPTLFQIFNSLAPDEAIQTMLDDAAKYTMKGAHSLSIKDIREYWAVRLWIASESKGTLVSHFPLSENLGNVSMGNVRYKRLQKMWITPNTIKKLNQAAQSLVSILPEVLTIDEKLVPFTGSTPYRRYVPNKDPNTGHWITEVTLKGPKTGLPYLVAARPIQQESGPSMLELYQDCLSWVNPVQRPNVVVVSDSYYMDDASRNWLRSSGFKYLAAINPIRFKEVWQPLQLKVKKKGQRAVAFNKRTNEAASHFWTDEGLKVYVLTNAFKYRHTPSPVNGIIVYDTYGLCFNTADRLNHYLYDRHIDYRRTRWQYSFDEFHFLTLVWNVFVVYSETYEEEFESWGAFLAALAKDTVQNLSK